MGKEGFFDGLKIWNAEPVKRGGMILQVWQFFQTASSFHFCHFRSLLGAVDFICVVIGVQSGNLPRHDCLRFHQSRALHGGNQGIQLRTEGKIMANIHFIGGEKGGVGKSVVAQHLIDKNLPFLGFDTDRSHGSLLSFYSAYASPVVVDRYESLDMIVEAANENPDKRILVDLAAQTREPLVKWMDESGMLEAAGELGFALQYWHVMVMFRSPSARVLASLC